MKKVIHVKVDGATAEQPGFALNQLLSWANQCYLAGCKQMVAEDSVAADGVGDLIASGVGKIACEIDFPSRVATFVLNVDHAGIDAQRMTLFSLVYEPEPPKH